MMSRAKCLRVLLVVVLCCCVGAERAVCQSANPVPLASIPFEYDPLTHPRLFVQASVNKQPPQTFLFDTGFGGAVLFTDWGATHAKVSRSAFYFGSDQFGDLQSTAVPNLSFPTAQNKSFVVQIGSVFSCIMEENHSLDMSGKRVAGLIGWQAFKGYGVELDFQARQLRLYRAKTLPSAFRDSKPLVLKQVATKLTVSAGFSPGSQKFLQIDTGSDQTLISWLAPSQTLSALAARITTTGFMGQEEMEAVTYVVPEFFIGHHRLTQCEIVVANRENMDVVALDMLTCFRVFLDLPGDKIYLKPRADKFNYPLPGFYDVGFQAKGDRVVVIGVRTDSPAERAGLKQGDTLLSVDGIQVDKSKLAELQRRLIGYAGTTATVEVEREKGERAVVSYTREDHYGFGVKNPSWRLGMELGSDKEGKILVRLLFAGSAALKAGILPGDRLVSMNGIPYSAENDARLREISRRGEELKIEVLRKGKPRTFVIPSQPALPETKN